MSVLLATWWNRMGLLAKPTNKSLSIGIPSLSTPSNTNSLSIGPDRFYPAQQHLQSRRGLTQGVQGRAIGTKFSTVGKEDMGIQLRDTITYAIITQYHNIAAIFMGHHYSQRIKHKYRLHQHKSNRSHRYSRKRLNHIYIMPL